jgi:hypothetical protein
MSDPTVIYAATADVEDALGRSLTDEELAKANHYLFLASALVAQEIDHYRVVPGTYTIGRYVNSRKVNMPGKVSSISEVRLIDPVDGSVTILVTADDYDLRGKTLYVHGVGYNVRALVEIDFVITELVPMDIVRVTAGVVASTIAQPMTDSTAEISGAYSVSQISSSGKVWLSASDKKILERYKSQTRAALDTLN